MSVQTTVEEIKSTEKKLSISVPRENVDTLYSQKVKDYQKKVRLDGFRAGKVPRHVVVARFGSAIQQEAVSETIEKTVQAEIKANEITPAAQPLLKDVKNEDGKPIELEVIVEIDPEFEVSGYQDMGISPAAVEFDESKVAEELEALRGRFSENKDVEGGAQDGNVVAGEYLELKIDGEIKEIPENPAFRVEIGASGTPGFDEKLIGSAAGETKEIEFTFPEDYHAEELQSKKAEYKLRVDSVSQVILPELDDEFGKKAGFDDLEGLKNKIKESIISGLESNALKEAQDKAMEKLLEINAFEVPESRVYHYVHAQLKKAEEETLTDEELENGREEALEAIRRFRILDAIANKEGLKAKQADVDARIQEMAGYYGLPFENLKADLRQSGRVVQLREELRLDKALKYIVGVQDEAKEA